MGKQELRPLPHSSLTRETRSRIRKAALELFNGDGTATVTTHDIAEAAEMSPGNFYYHYKNKEAVIRDIFYEMEIYSIERWLERGPQSGRGNFVDFIQFFFGNLFKYRFFFREFSALLNADPVLKKMWRDYNDDLRTTLERAAHLWMEAGILRKFSSPAKLVAFVDNAWVLSHFSVSYLESRKSLSDKRAHEESLRLFVRYLYPYHTEKGQRALDLYLESA